jgi:hypothetical protein
MGSALPADTAAFDTPRSVYRGFFVTGHMYVKSTQVESTPVEVSDHKRFYQD